MAHFAHLDANNIVKKVSVVSNDIETSNGPLGDNDMHVDGETWCANFHNDPKAAWTTRENIVAWKQTSYNNNFRKQYASLGGTYDPVRDEFVKPADPEKPSWVLNATNDWVAPISSFPPTDVNSSTLDGALTDASTSIVLNDSTGFPASGVVRIDDERIGFTSHDSGTKTLSGLTRGRDDTTAVLHLDAASVLNVSNPEPLWEEDNQRFITWRSKEQVNPDIWNPETSQWELGE
jgi:hypothetical protein